MTEMSTPLQSDSLQDRITAFAGGLNYRALSTEEIAAVKSRIIDTFAAAFAGFFSDVARNARQYAERFPASDGATIIGTRSRTAPEIAAFVNAIASRQAEWNDVYMSRGGGGAHPSDVILPILAAAEAARASGREFMTSVVIAYEIYLNISDVVRIAGFDQSTIAGIAVAAASGRVLGLTREQLHHAVAICAVANNPLQQTRRAQLSMWKAAAAGQAGKAGVSAALMARAGFEGPQFPFEGVAGWNKVVAKNQFTVGGLDSKGGPYRIVDSLIKPRASCAVTISSIFAAEDAAKKNVKTRDIEHVLVEVYQSAKDSVGSGAERWNPTSSETADHSIPYVVAAALTDGYVGPLQFKDDRLWDPELRTLIQKVEVVANDQFTKAYERYPREHLTRVTVQTKQGKTLVGNAGGASHEDMGKAKTAAEIERKFKALVGDYLGKQRTQAALERMWQLDTIDDVREVPDLFSIF